MSDINELIHSNAKRAFEQGFKTGRKLQHKETLYRLKAYFGLTLMPADNNQADKNPEWDAGYQAAFKIAEGMETE